MNLKALEAGVPRSEEASSISDIVFEWIERRADKKHDVYCLFYGMAIFTYLIVEMPCSVQYGLKSQIKVILITLYSVVWFSESG